jgi:NADH:ubiquinone oxidoreductase subunit F (NADH-binding)
MKEISACGLGMAAPLVVESLVRYFPEQVETHVLNGKLKDHDTEQRFLA